MNETTTQNTRACLLSTHMGENFQDYSWIQDFEADFPQKVGLKMLNRKNYSRFSYLYTACLKTIGHLYLKLWILVGILQVLRFRILEILNFHPCTQHMY